MVGTYSNPYPRSLVVWRECLVRACVSTPKTTTLLLLPLNNWFLWKLLPPRDNSVGEKGRCFWCPIMADLAASAYGAVRVQGSRAEAGRRYLGVRYYCRRYRYVRYFRTATRTISLAEPPFNLRITVCKLQAPCTPRRIATSVNGV